MIRTSFSRLIFACAAILLAVGLSGCQSTDTGIDQPIPKEINDFVQRYFPEQNISAFGSTPTGGYHLKLANSAAIIFSSTCSWESVNGNGSALPEMLLFDQLPPALYEYIQNIGALNQVYAIARNARTYTAHLLDTNLTYDIATSKITQE